MNAVNDAGRRLGAALDAMDPWVRITFAEDTLRAIRDASPDAQPIWATLHLLTEQMSDQTRRERLAHLVSTLEVAAPATRQTIRAAATSAVRAAIPPAHFWPALAKLCKALDRASAGGTR